jgi:hypothetical protein
MARPARNAIPEKALSSSRIFFATTKTLMGRLLSASVVSQQPRIRPGDMGVFQY